MPQVSILSVDVTTTDFLCNIWLSMRVNNISSVLWSEIILSISSITTKS